MEQISLCRDEAKEVTPTKKSSREGILPLLLAFRRSMAQPGQPSTTGAGSSSGASSLPISTIASIT